MVSAIQINISENPYSQLSYYKGIFTRIHNNKENSREFEVVYEVNYEDFRKKINFFSCGNKFLPSEKEDILKQFNLQINNGLVSSSAGKNNFNKG